eukprot:scaffold9701_cov17-Prasinocladus_malaysianus.AAC.1
MPVHGGLFGGFLRLYMLLLSVSSTLVHSICWIDLCGSMQMMMSFTRDMNSIKREHSCGSSVRMICELFLQRHVQAEEAKCCSSAP